ncbi:ribonucleotide reductase N-terminal alpha domain-containing protein [Haladaptatus sp. DJG-WS-42]|uniref:ribonucleotide reductase N-terminal alpha domain-containing protein n=1 Tax=Haladaptatus sp. DJG-WS-42 TaxID=3120516 RepID=UPI0030D10467
MSHQHSHTDADSIRSILDHPRLGDRLPTDVRDDLADEADRKLSPDADRKDVFEFLIQSLLARSERESGFESLAATLFRDRYYEQLLGETVGSDTFSEAYRTHFRDSIRAGVARGVFDERLGEYNLRELADCLVPARDAALGYRALETLTSDSFLRSRAGQPRELPQTCWMRVAMTLALTEDEQRRIDHAIDYYDVLSMLDW